MATAIIMKIKLCPVRPKHSVVDFGIKKSDCVCEISFNFETLIL